MSDFLNTLGAALRAAAIYELNGLLALLYGAWAGLAGLVAAAGCLALLWWTPPGRTRQPLSGQRPWLLGAGVVVILAVFLARPPASVLLAVMTVAGAVAVRFDRFNADGLRWRVVGGLVLYALAAFAYLAYGAYLNSLDAAAWAEALGGQGEAAATLAQGRAFIATLATWGLWLILPLGYFSLLVQGLLVHPPLPATPEQVLTAVRTRGESR